MGFSLKTLTLRPPERPVWPVASRSFPAGILRVRRRLLTGWLTGSPDGDLEVTGALVAMVWVSLVNLVALSVSGSYRSSGDSCDRRERRSGMLAMLDVEMQDQICNVVCGTSREGVREVQREARAEGWIIQQQQ